MPHNLANQILFIFNELLHFSQIKLSSMYLLECMYVLICVLPSVSVFQRECPLKATHAKQTLIAGHHLHPKVKSRDREQSVTHTHILMNSQAS